MKGSRIRPHLLLFCLATGLVSYILLDAWSARNAPLYRRFERFWSQDVELLTRSSKLPKSWYEVSEIKIIPGSIETKNLLNRFESPLKVTKLDGPNRLEVIVYAWKEGEKIGVLMQYNIEDIASRNTLWELNRTLILQSPDLLPKWLENIVELRQ